MARCPILPMAADLCRTALVTAKIRIIASVRETHQAIDIACAKRFTLVLRCVLRPNDADSSSLKIMLAEGDFDRAVLVYCDDAGPLVSGEIESWPLSRIDELAAKLAAECAAS